MINMLIQLTVIGVCIELTRLGAVIRTNYSSFQNILSLFQKYMNTKPYIKLYI